MHPNREKRDKNIMRAMVKIGCSTLQPGRRCQTVPGPPAAEVAGETSYQQQGHAGGGAGRGLA